MKRYANGKAGRPQFILDSTSTGYASLIIFRSRLCYSVASVRRHLPSVVCDVCIVAI